MRVMGVSSPPHHDERIAMAENVTNLRFFGLRPILVCPIRSRSSHDPAFSAWQIHRRSVPRPRQHGPSLLVHAPNGTEVVVKFMHPQRATQASFRKLFASEVRIMSGFFHPDTVRFLEGGHDETGGPCIVMEYVHGMELRELIKQCGRIDAERLAGLVLPLCRAIHAAHEAGIVHRDLKPANLMVTNPGSDQESIKVMDMGLAALASQVYLPLANLNGSDCGDLVGTRAYMCPEQIRGDDFDARGDMYSIGVLMFEALTGHLPFTCEDPIGILRSHLHDKPPTFASLGIDNVHHRIEELVHRLLAKFPNERPETGFDLANDYYRALGRKVTLKRADILSRTGACPRRKSDPDDCLDFCAGTNESGWTQRLKKILGR